jgi:hypothetical protein
LTAPHLLTSIKLVAIQPLLEEIQMMKQDNKTPILLTETETDRVAGGAGNHFGQEAKDLGVHPWELQGFKGKAADAPGHQP